MGNYTFIKRVHSGYCPNPILAIYIEIEELKLHETYDQFGQLVGHDNAGDYSIYNQYSYADADCLKELIEHFQITSQANDYNNPDDVDFLSIGSGGEIEITLNIEEQDIENFDRAKINAFIQKWEEENAGYNSVKGFNYWSGRKWQTVIVEDPVWDNPTHKIIENNSLEHEIDTKELIRKSFGKQIYESENYWIIENQYSYLFADYEMYAKEEYDLEDIFYKP